jgi:DNA polymerase-4
VAAQLREEGLVARTVTLKLRHDDFKTVTRRHTLETPTDLDAELYQPARTMFREAFEEVRGRDRGVRLIGVGTTGLGKAAEPDLFEPADRARRRRLTAAVDQVRERFGFNALAEARLLSLKHSAPD